MRTLTHKGYARIYVKDEKDIEKVKSIISEMDDFEYAYLPDDMITVYSEYPKTVYTHKFSDLDMDALTNECWKKGIYIWIYDEGVSDNRHAYML